MSRNGSSRVIGSWVIAGAVLLAGSLASAQDFQNFFRGWDSSQPVRYQVTEQEAAPLEVGDHWIGVLCQPAGDPIKAQLKLDHGLVVEHLVPDGPAAKAGIEPDDVLLSFGEKKLAEVADLVEAIKAAKDTETELKFVRAGQEKSVKLTPAKRPEGDAGILPGFTPEELKGWFEGVVPEGMENAPFRLHRFRPGVVLPETAKPLELPDNLIISISKQGEEKAKITVTKDGKTFAATEDKLEDLPEDVRPYAARLLGRGAAIELDFDALKWVPEDIAKKLPQIRKEWQFGPAPQIRVYPGRPGQQMLKAEQRMREQLAQMRRSLDELQQQLDNLHSQAEQAADEKKPDEGKVEPEKQPDAGKTEAEPAKPKD